MGTEQSLDADPHGEIVIDDENGLVLRQGGSLSDPNRRHGLHSASAPEDRASPTSSISRAAARSQEHLVTDI
jgi:hypothetical protein